MTAAGIGFPARGFRGVETDVRSRARRVVGVEHGLDRSLAHESAGDAGGDALAGHVGQHFVFELRRIRAAFADQVAVEPLLSDALELPKQMELGIFAGVAPFVQDEVGSQLVQNLRGANVSGMNQIEVNLFADDP